MPFPSDPDEATPFAATGDIYHGYVDVSGHVFTHRRDAPAPYVVKRSKLCAGVCLVGGLLSVACLQIRPSRGFWGSSPQKRCVFIHGAGIELDQPVRDDFSQYWGPVKAWTGHCMSHAFLHRNTMTVNWTHPALQKAVCDLVVGNVSNASNPIAEDVIIFAHSMGNLVLGGALANGLCALAPSASWYEISAPLRGCLSADFAEEECREYGANAISHKMGYCDGFEAFSSVCLLHKFYSGNFALKAFYFLNTASFLVGECLSFISTYWLVS